MDLSERQLCSNNCNHLHLELFQIPSPQPTGANAEDFFGGTIGEYKLLLRVHETDAFA